MPHIYRRFTSLVLLAGASGLLVLTLPQAGCDQRAEPATPTFLRVGFGMGPSARVEAVSVLRSMLYAEGLVTHDWNGFTRPALVETWSWDPPRTTLHLVLKKNVVFHDGSPVTPDAIVAFLQQGAMKTLGFTYVEAISATGPLTIDIKLSRPDAFLLPELSDIRVTHPTDVNVGTGPFVLVNRDPVETKRFDRYHEGAPFLSGVNIAIYDSQRSAWAALMKGEVDVVQEVSRESMEFMKGNSRLRALSTVQPFYVPIFLNQSHPALRHVEVRRAMMQAINRPAIIERAMNGFGQVAHGPIWPQHWAYTAPSTGYEFDPQAARARLDRAGFPVIPRRGSPNSRFSFRCTVWNGDSQYERIALMVQRQLLDVGIDMTLEMATLEDIMRRGAVGEFDGLLVRANSSRTLNYTYQIWRSLTGKGAPYIDTGYTGTHEAFDRFRVALTEEETRAMVTALVERFHHDVPALFIAWLEVTRAVDTRFDVAGDRSMPDPFANLRLWRLADSPN